MHYDTMDKINISDYPNDIHWRCQRLAVLWYRTNHPNIFRSNKYDIELSDYKEYLGVPNDVYDLAHSYYAQFYNEK